MQTKNYSFGAKAPFVGADLVADQMRLGARYRNRLIEIERWRRAFRADGRDKDELHEAVLEAQRDARGASGLPWGSYLAIEAAVQQAARTVGHFRATKPGRCGRCAQEFAVGDWIETASHRVVACCRCGPALRFRRDDGGGVVAVHIQSRPLSVSDLLGCRDTRVRLAPAQLAPTRHATVSHKRWVLSLRVGSDKRGPVWAEFPVFLHRPLLLDAEVLWVYVHARRVAESLEWTATFTLKSAGQLGSVLPAPTKGTVAVDVGWRRIGDELRVAVWRDDAGNGGELRLSAHDLGGFRKVHDLRSIRDCHWNEARADLVRARENQGRPGAAPWPVWMVERTRTVAQWRSPERLAALVRYWRGARFDGDTVLFDRFEAWRKKSRHLHEWEAHQMAGACRHRRELYRVLAARLAAYRRIAVEDLDLRDFAEKPVGDEPKDDPQTANARTWRTVACLSDLVAAIKDAAGRAGCELIEVPAARTTQTCPECRQPEPFDAAPAVEHTCAQCGATWDQDVAAARNILRAALSSPPTGGRSRTEPPGTTGETPAQKRRAAALATRRAGRSRKAMQTPEVL